MQYVDPGVFALTAVRALHAQRNDKPMRRPVL
jgi:hypothetical protein